MTLLYDILLIYYPMIKTETRNHFVSFKPLTAVEVCFLVPWKGGPGTIFTGRNEVGPR